MTEEYFNDAQKIILELLESKEPDNYSFAATLADTLIKETLLNSYNLESITYVTNLRIINFKFNDGNNLHSISLGGFKNLMTYDYCVSLFKWADYLKDAHDWCKMMNYIELTAFPKIKINNEHANNSILGRMDV